MELVIALIIVGLLVVAAMALFGRGRGDVADEDTPDRTQVTDVDRPPPAHPARPVPGSAPDRARKGRATRQQGSEVARRRG